MEVSMRAAEAVHATQAQVDCLLRLRRPSNDSRGQQAVHHLHTSHCVERHGLTRQVSQNRRSCIPLNRGWCGCNGR